MTRASRSWNTSSTRESDTNYMYRTAIAALAGHLDRAQTLEEVCLADAKAAGVAISATNSREPTLCLIRAVVPVRTTRTIAEGNLTIRSL